MPRAQRSTAQPSRHEQPSPEHRQGETIHTRERRPGPGSSITATLLEPSVHWLPTGAFGAPGQRMHALLLGRASISLMGLFVLPGVVDSDSDHEIMIMAWTPRLPFTVPQGT